MSDLLIMGKSSTVNEEHVTNYIFLNVYIYIRLHAYASGNDELLIRKISSIWGNVNLNSFVLHYESYSKIE